MLIKVCGMREPENIRQVAALGADWMGFIFYPRSPRYIGSEAGSGRHETYPCRKVGVFVDATQEEMLKAATDCRLDYLQLHGSESPDDCYALQKRGIGVIKAFAIASADDLAKTAPYEGRADYFLFDTKCSGFGGSGQRFDWSLLASYTGETPFLLSGGIKPESLGDLVGFSHPRLTGIDLNSGFETAPGQKDVRQLELFIQQIKQQTNNKSI